MELLSGGEMIARALEDEGVEFIFGYPGGAVLHIYDALFKSCKVPHILVRHEQAATHAADGYARATGKPGVVLVTSGPGATNAITGIATAYMDSIPMVVLSGQVMSHLIGEDAFQETDMLGISRPIVKHSFQVTKTEEIPEMIKKAFYIASSGRPGPVVVDLPKDLTNPHDKFEYNYPKKVKLRSYTPASRGHSGQIKKAASLLPLEGWRCQLAQRLKALRGVASAMQYLHDDCRVVYRDCKPENIGFHRGYDHGGFTDVPKLFDFGLAKELKPKLLKAHPHHDDGRHEDTYLLTARSGSRRYMAPEVAFATPYNEKADVYSFGIMLYQVASLVTPFDGYSHSQHEKEVLCNGGRPDLRIPAGRRALAKVTKAASLSYADWQELHIMERQTRQLEACTKCAWTPGLRRLIEQCWNDDMRERPRMRDVVSRLEDCVEELTPKQRRKGSLQDTECLSCSDRTANRRRLAGEVGERVGGADDAGRLAITVTGE